MLPDDRRPGRRVLLGVALFLSLVVVALHYEALLLGQVYHMDDAADGYYPSHVAAARAYAHGELPTWEQNAWCGWPLAADPYYAVFYPLTALFFLSPVHALGYVIALHAIAAALALFVLVRRRGGSIEAGLFAALSLALSTFVVERIRHVIFVQLLVWWVLTLIGVEDLLAARGRRGVAAALIALGVGMMLLCGALPLLPFAALGIGAYVVPRTLQLVPGGRARARAFAQLAGAAALGGLLGAAQLLPTLAHLPLSPRALGADFEFASSYAWPDPSYLLLLVAPHLYGLGDKSRWFGAFNHWEMAGYYVGVWPVVLALGALWRPRLDRVVLFGLIAIAVVLAFGKATPLHGLLWKYLPLYGGLRCPTRALVIFVVFTPLLAADGLDRWFAAPAVTRAWLHRAAAIVLVLAAGGLVAKLVLAAPPRESADLARNRALVQLVVTLCVGTAALLGLAGPRRWQRPARLLVMVNLLDLFVVSRLHIDARPSDWAAGTDHFQAVAWLEKNGGSDRFAPDAYGPFRLHNAGMTYDLPSAGGYDSVTTWNIVHFLWLLNNRAPYPHDALKHDLAAGFIKRWDSPLIDLLNIKWAMTFGPPGPRWKERFAFAGKPLAVHEPAHDSRLHIYENPNVLPRAFAVTKAIVEPNDAKAARALLRLDPHKEVLLTSAPPIAPSGVAKDAIPAKPLLLGRHKLRFEIEVTENAVLVISQTHYPGWRAYVDTEEQPLLRADYALSAVAIGPGKHTVELRFTSRPVQLGLLLSAIAALLIGALAMRRPRIFTTEVRRSGEKPAS